MYLQRALEAPATDTDLRHAVMVNLATCLQQAGKSARAQAMISEREPRTVGPVIPRPYSSWNLSPLRVHST